MALPTPGGAETTLLVRLAWSAGEPLRGWVGRPGAEGIAFCGWIDLMSAISSLCVEASALEAQRPPRESLMIQGSLDAEGRPEP